MSIDADSRGQRSLRWSHALRRAPVRRPACWCRSAGRRSPTTSSRSWRTSPAAAASRASGSRRSASTTHLFGGRSPINDQNRVPARRHPRGPRRRRPRPARLLGQPQLGPLPRRRGAPRCATTASPRAASFLTSAYSSYSSCRQYRENLAAAAAAVARRAAARPAARLLQPPAVHRAGGRRHPGRAGRAARRRPQRRPPRLRDPLDPGRHERAQRPVGSRLPRPAPVRRHRRGRAGAPGGRPQAPLAAGVLLALGAAAACRGSSPTSTTTSRSSPRTAPAPRWWCPSVSSPTTWRSSTTSTPRPLATAERLSFPVSRAATPGIDPRFVGLPRELLVERAATERGEEVPRVAVGGLMAAPDLCAAGCCPNLRGERPVVGGPQAPPKLTSRDPTDPAGRAAATRPRGGPRRGRPHPRAPYPRGAASPTPSPATSTW